MTERQAFCPYRGDLANPAKARHVPAETGEDEWTFPEIAPWQEETLAFYASYAALLGESPDFVWMQRFQRRVMLGMPA